MSLISGRNPVLAVCTLAVVSLAVPAQGVLRKLDLAALVRRSEAILCGEVVSTRCYRSRFLDVGELIFTDVTVKISDRISGYVPDATITIQVPGGAIDGLEMVCPDAPRYEKGEKVIVFLRRFNERCWNVAWSLGKYTLTTATAASDSPSRTESGTQSGTETQTQTQVQTQVQVQARDATRVQGRRGTPIPQTVDLETLRSSIARILSHPEASR